MVMITDVRDTLNGGFSGLYGEVVDCDVYQLKEVKFQPRVVFDVGSNVGVFARYAREMFPNALIVCVEPDEENFEYLTRFTRDSNMVFINKAIGHGQMWRFLNCINGAHEMYINTGIGYPELSTSVDARLVKSNVETVTLDEIINEYLVDGGSVLKLDVEGNEADIWSHEPSMKALAKIDYICGETHPFALHPALVLKVNEANNLAFEELSKTHIVRRHGVNFWAFKK